ncbi:MAG: Na-K-Cl cotransporter [Chloroflexi bacterium]|nr:Na-K-Cl cotransporter [Chloroflexota bacterium]
MNKLLAIVDSVRSRFSRPSTATEKVTLFGTFEGVFLPTLLTILGAVMYLRTGWVVGNAGLIGALVVITLANIITIATGLSISSVATNIRVGAGGSFSIISQSLGLEVGGSVNVPLYLAQAISVAFYIFAFAEGWQVVFPSHLQALVLFATFAVISIISFVSVGLAARARYLILFLVAFSLFSILLGATERFGHPGAVYTPQLWGSFIGGDFWAVFAVFFPAATGILAGVSLSGTLKDPRRSIPLGTMAAVLISFAIYMILAYWLSLVATPEELITNLTIMVDKAAWGWAVLAGLLAATFSAALNSMVSAPRVLQAMAEHEVVPFSRILARKTESGEPRVAMLLTIGIGIATLLFGLSGAGLNQIAPLMTMFFLITYAVLNGVVLLEQSLGLTSFRPLLRIPRLVPLIGLVGSLVAMFLINPLFSLAALITIFLLYEALQLQQLTAPWSDVRSGMFVTVAEWAAKKVLAMPSGQDRAWKPSLLAPVDSSEALRRSYRFLTAITRPNGSVHIVVVYGANQREQVEGLKAYEETFGKDNIFARVALVESRDLSHTLQTTMAVSSSSFFRPNTLFLTVNDQEEAEKLQYLADKAKENRIGLILYVDNSKTLLGHEQTINVWIREQSPDWEIGLRLTNLDLALLLAYQLARNWQGHINLITVVGDENDRAQAETFLNQLIDLGRMPRGTSSIVAAGPVQDFIPRAPQADLNIFGLQHKVDVEQIHAWTQMVNSTCIFVRDSGNESALV